MSRFRLLISLVIFSVFVNCTEEIEENSYPQKMRDFVIGISSYAKSIDTNFIIIPQNGQELLIENLEENGTPATSYINAIDGVGREDLFYGYEDDDIATPKEDVNYMMSFLNVAKNNGVTVLVTDYCFSHSKMDDSYRRNSEMSFISYAADSRELDRVQSYPDLPYNNNQDNITSLSRARNFLYLLAPDDNYSTKDDYLNALRAMNHDVFIIDAFYKEEILTKDDVASLCTKESGGNRLVIAYMSIGEAEDYRYYWKSHWNQDKPSWIAGENPAWPGNYKVKYWESEWQSIIFGSVDSYLDIIVESGFNGVYLDIIDAYEYFQNQGKWWVQY